MSPAEQFLVGFVVFIIVWGTYDGFIIKRGDESISWGVKTMAQKAPILAFGLGLIVGILGGHWFWQMC